MSKLVLPEHGKSQTVRLIDIFLLGPVLMYLGTRQKKPLERWVLIGSGAATVIYNYMNYSKVCRRTAAIAGQLASQGSRPSFDRTRLVRPDDFESYRGCGLLT